ncbi:MAG: two-component regulator propeller domain-containing protein [Bacteroidota bacterium]
MRVKQIGWMFMLSWLLLLEVEAQVHRFEQLPARYGLSESIITSILADHQGYLWVGTWMGLYRYDGYRGYHIIANPQDSNSLQSNKITCLFEDQHHVIWVGTRNGGVYQYDRSQESFKAFKHLPEDPASLSNNSVWHISADAQGNIWLGTEYGLNRWQPETASFQRYFHGQDSVHNFIRSVSFDGYGGLWAGSERGLIYWPKPGEVSQSINYLLHPEGEQAFSATWLAHNFVRSVYRMPDDQAFLWVGTTHGLKKVFLPGPATQQLRIQYFDPDPDQAGSLSNLIVPSMISSPADPHTLWVATYGGLNKLDTQQGTFTVFRADETPFSLVNHTIRSIAVDRNQILWLGTDKGLQKLNLRANPWSLYPLSSHPSLANAGITVMERSNRPEGFWIGTQGKGIHYLNKYPAEAGGQDMYQSVNLLGADLPEYVDFVSDIALDRAGRIWVATLGAGIWTASEDKILTNSQGLREFQQFTMTTERLQLPETDVMALAPSRMGGVWMGYWDEGLAWVADDPLNAIHFTQSLEGKVDFRDFPNVHVAEQLEDEALILWVASRGGGLLKLSYDPKRKGLHLLQWYHRDAPPAYRLSTNFVNTFHQDKKGRLWIGSENGVDIFDEGQGKIKHFGQEDGLAVPFVNSIFQENQSDYWVGTFKGLVKISEPTSEQWQVTYYDEADGLLADRFTINAVLQDEQGKIYWGGDKGVSSIHSQDLGVDSIPPRIVMTDMKLFNRSVGIGQDYDGEVILTQHISETDHISLPFDFNVLTFDFVGLHLGRPSQHEYAYRLKGFSDEWVYRDARQRQAHYTSLPPDEYVFQIKVANSDGVWSPINEPFSLTIRPPFWRTIWAYALYALLFLALLYGVRAITLMRANLENRLNIERLEREKLAEVNHMKMRFFTNISHDLRTPLTLILSPLEQLLKDRSNERKQYNTFLRMHQNGNRLLHMINQLLDIRKSEAGLLRLQVGEGNIARFCEEVCLAFQGLAMQRKIQLTFLDEMPPGDSARVFFDRDQMEKVWFNLLSNALKFTPIGGEVYLRVGLDQAKQMLKITVEDTGAGIAEEELPYIFDRYYQGDQRGKKEKQEGTGIGLALVKKIVEAHQGRLEVQSKLGKGSRFNIYLKKGHAHFKSDEIIANFRNSEDVGRYAPSPHPDLRSADPDPQLQVAPLPSGRHEHILLVEDNADIRAYLRENLQHRYRISEATQGIEALEIALAELPDLIISDIAMPKMDGITFCREIKSRMETSHIPVILLTARTSLIFKVDGFETGADDYITKPFNMRLLETRIKNLIDNRKKLQEKFSGSFELSPSKIAVNSLDQDFLNRIKQIVEAHMEESNFSVEDLAGEMGLSRMQLYRKLKALTGNSPHKVMLKIRLTYAAKLLETGRYNVSEVTYMVGYNDLKSFRDQFKKEFGVIPSAY